MELFVAKLKSDCVEWPEDARLLYNSTYGIGLLNMASAEEIITLKKAI